MANLVRRQNTFNELFDLRSSFDHLFNKVANHSAGTEDQGAKLIFVYRPGLAERPETESGREQSHFGKPYELVGVGRSEVIPFLLAFEIFVSSRCPCFVEARSSCNLPSIPPSLFNTNNSYIPRAASTLTSKSCSSFNGAAVPTNFTLSPMHSSTAPPLSSQFGLIATG
jgi:hypothetical protein